MSDTSHAEPTPALESDIDEQIIGLAEEALEVAKTVLSAAEKLRANRAAQDGDATLHLPETNIVVTFPRFRPHGPMMKAQRLAKGKHDEVFPIYAVNVCRFDGEKLTLEDFKLMPLGDFNLLMAELMGADDQEDADSPPG